MMTYAEVVKIAVNYLEIIENLNKVTATQDRQRDLTELRIFEENLKKSTPDADKILDLCENIKLQKDEYYINAIERTIHEIAQQHPMQVSLYGHPLLNIDSYQQYQLMNYTALLITLGFFISIIFAPIPTLIVLAACMLITIPLAAMCETKYINTAPLINYCKSLEALKSEYKAVNIATSRLLNSRDNGKNEMTNEDVQHCSSLFTQEEPTNNNVANENNTKVTHTA
ncbi:MAG: hypothetical protein A3F18_04285 [Legionellales bacterium RIFCSPHIGHO2_12_FULL_37_14]|nr:MAG: hypothetical protein A3F18_04285 [Legionellales bacterium RIFCSPHIGHO2_12_FULL_37_14]